MAVIGNSPETQKHSWEVFVKHHHKEWNIDNMSVRQDKHLSLRPFCVCSVRVCTKAEWREWHLITLNKFCCIHQESPVHLFTWHRKWMCSSCLTRGGPHCAYMIMVNHILLLGVLGRVVQIIHFPEWIMVKVGSANFVCVWVANMCGQGYLAIWASGSCRDQPAPFRRVRGREINSFISSFCPTHWLCWA